MIRHIITPFITFITLVAMLCVPLESQASEPFTLVIDAGHGGKDTGAVGNGVKEKDINLGVALKLGDMIKKKLKNVKVVYTRDNDSFITLQGRADKANASKGNLFVSIHTNSVDKSNKNRTTVAGASVYALGLHKDKNNMDVARRENAVIELEKDYQEKYSGFDPASDESYIIFEMAQKKNLSQSIRFANMAQKSLVANAGRRDRGVHQAGFWVLWATSMPSVLVELDFICNPNSAKYMGSEQGQTKLAEALFSAVKDYVDTYAQTGDRKSKKKDELKSDVREETPAAGGVAVTTPAGTSDRKVGNGTGAGKSSSSRKPQEARRRRSDAGRDLSSARDVSVDSIPVRPASRPLAVAQQDSDKDKEEKSTEVALTKAEAKAKAKAEAEAKKKAEAEARKKAREEKKNRHGKISRLKTVYKIQLCASTELLKQSDPRFQGFSPVSYYRENNLYKYTYGETSSEEEIRKTLEKVQKKIPDAFIVKSIN